MAFRRDGHPNFETTRIGFAQEGGTECYTVGIAGAGPVGAIAAARRASMGIDVVRCETTESAARASVG